MHQCKNMNALAPIVQCPTFPLKENAMTVPTKETIIAALRAIETPGGGDLVSRDLTRAIMVKPDGGVSFVIEAESPDQARMLEGTRAKAEAAVAALSGVTRVSALLTAHGPSEPTPRPTTPPPSLKIGGHPKPSAPGAQEIPGVARILAIGSGKGGVGKSTVSSNLAVALAKAGRRVGLLDADIYGPSQPRMMGVSERPKSPDGKIIEPLHAHGVTMMSIGLMVDPDQAVVWRGPMLMGALQQMLGQVRWGELDVLLVDLPPGTGDVQLTLCQKSKITGAIVVSTPQDVALLDAKKALNMFDQLNTPVLGLIENMSTYICPECGHEAHLFGNGGVAAEAARAGLPFLGALPLELEVRLAGDAGVPIAVGDSPAAVAYSVLAQRLIDSGMA
jgi:ATP-binding protein involved in chromosome partitioning